MKTSYVAPQIEVVEIEFEGVLCASGNSSIEKTSPGINIDQQKQQ